MNVCYAAIGEDEDISIAQVFRVADGRIVATPVPGGTSPPDLSRGRLEHRYAESWLRNILAEMSG
ncbi:FCSD flavin-binding domain-containing protein [Cognatazoarcus halotolerans]|uniref:FCSD flavin-binding domain-containing protein n=1 Tax=Cognatazoarcus halotolerans TaxID=2686016 RepID=UPI00135C055D|nr:FCSD flavin-binding domain-containing protein [Rhodocyclaceae bacterium]MCP5307696.1 FCSD flavin-binding domain-containing protein [Zoogloeaceae bacterium]